MDQNKIAQLQMLEQNMQHLLQQKQVFQTQQVEINNALEEVTKSEKDVYKVLGTVMVKSKKENILKDLNSKKEVIELRLKSLEKQEKQLKEKSKDLQKETIKKWKN